MPNLLPSVVIPLAVGLSALTGCSRPDPATATPSQAAPSPTLSPASAESETYTRFVQQQKAGIESTLPDYSWAGYRLGAEGIAPVTGPVFNVLDYGAKPDDEIEDREQIQNAIRAAEQAGGGVVFFPPGRFLINELPDRTKGIEISKPGIVLRGSGSGPGGTELFMRHYMLPQSPEKLWTVPHMFVFKAKGLPGPLAVANVAADAPRGGFQIEVDDASRLAAGEMIELRMRNPEANAEFLDGLVPWEKWHETNTKGVLIAEKHQIKGIKGNLVELAEPLRTRVTSRYGWKVSKISLAGGWGVEDIWFRGNFQEAFSHHKNFIHDSGWRAFNLRDGRDAWVRRVRFTDVNGGVQFVGCFGASALLLRFDGNPGHTMVGTEVGYGTLIGLVEDATNGGIWHGPSMARSSTGTVVWRFKGQPSNGPDPHASWPYCTLVDASSCDLIHNGGYVGLLPNHMKDFTFWNLHALGDPRQDYDFWDPQPAKDISYTGAKIVRPNIIGLHGAASTFVRDHLGLYQENGNPVSPESLYEAQLKLRLGETPAWVEEAKAEWADYQAAGSFKVGR